MRRLVGIAICLVAACGKGDRKPTPTASDAARRAVASDATVTATGDSGSSASTGPTSRVVALSQVTSRPEHDDDGVVVRILLEPAPGHARLPDLDLELTAAGTSLGTARARPLGIWLTEAYVVFPRPPAAAKIALTVDGQVYGTLDVDPSMTALPSIVRPIERPPAGRFCEGLECPGFPALSLDGATLAVRDEDEALPIGDFCKPPTAELTTYYSVPRRGVSMLTPIASTDLTDYEVLRCEDGAQLDDGYRVELGAVGDQTLVTVRDEAGKTHHEVLVDAVPRFCSSRLQRVLVVQVRPAPRDECDVAGRAVYFALRY